MKELENNAYFWQKIDSLYLSGDFKVLHKKGSKHPNFPKLIFPADYGLIDADKSNTIRFFKGDNGNNYVDAIIISANILEREIRCVGLVGLSQNEEEAILMMLNQTDFQKTILVRRGNTVPSWAQTE